jgi:hypothetical protein
VAGISAFGRVMLFYGFHFCARERKKKTKTCQVPERSPQAMNRVRTLTA